MKQAKIEQANTSIMQHLDRIDSLGISYWKFDGNEMRICQKCDWNIMIYIAVSQILMSINLCIAKITWVYKAH